MPRKKSPITVRIEELDTALAIIQPKVLKKTGRTLDSLHGVIGGKYNDYIDSVRGQFLSPEQFITEWEAGVLNKVADTDAAQLEHYGEVYQDSAAHRILRWLQIPLLRKYMHIFHERNFYRNYKARTRTKPGEDLWEIWMGQTNLEHGLLITPRLAGDEWENDVSEIRHVKFEYWTIGHVLASGLVIPDEAEQIPFDDAADYLRYFRVNMVKPNASEYGNQMAKLYSRYVLDQDDPELVPLLIPEFRYEGKIVKHKHRLDFALFSAPKSLRLGIELSPWSTHGKIKGIKAIEAGGGKAAVEAKRIEKFESEMGKRNNYFQKFSITTLTFTDKKLKDMDAAFEELKPYLVRQNEGMTSAPDVTRRIEEYEFHDTE